MATRTIVTSQPDVACYVCARRLLRGEQPDVFLAAGRRRTVCELCAPRASHEGWLRETDRHSMSVAPARARRARNLFDRLRQLREPPPASAEGAAATSPLYAGEPRDSYDFLDGLAPVAGEEEPVSVPVDGESSPSQAVAGEGVVADGDVPALTGGDVKIERALAVFNAGEHPRRVAGVARSLGLPSVSVRPVEDAGSVVAIVVAWELCWYRYEVDLGDEAAGARALAQGAELEELAREERLANAVADELGALSLTGV
jgi:hypothetical protein